MSVKRLKALDNVRDFNEKFEVGQKVIFMGVEYKTWSPAALNARDEPCVFLASKNIEEPVLISQIEIEGWEIIYGKRAKKKEK